MSLVFNDTLTKRGIVQLYESECGYSDGDVSGNTTRLKKLTADVNLALDDFTALAIKADGRWQFDDSNQTDYPILTTNLVAGQRDYAFTTDNAGNLILDIFKVFVASQTGVFTELRPVDVESGDDSPLIGAASGQIGSASMSSFTDGRNATGTPNRYDKLGNGIFLDPVPSYSYANGLKVYVNREGSYFAYGDTTKKPGVPGLFHRYFALKPALDYCRRNNRKNYAAIAAEILKFEGDEARGIVGSIQAYFSRRNKDERARLTAGRDSNK
jgi:hypothetical protein